MNRLAAPLVAALTLTIATPALRAQERAWPIHSIERPRPPIVAPGPTSAPVPPPADALVLFDGTSLDRWQNQEGKPAGWRVAGGVVTVQRTGSIETRERFGDVQLHVEWATPSPATGAGQGRGNSGIFLMGYYEVQILDSYRNDTYPDGQAGALYGQAPPAVNASRPPGEWQTFDIVFRRPIFRPDGSVERPARVTVLHNGVLIHDAAAFSGRTEHGKPARYTPHPDALPLSIQDHGDPIRFRNIWIRRL